MALWLSLGVVIRFAPVGKGERDMAVARGAVRRVQVSTKPPIVSRALAEVVGTAFLTGIGTAAVVSTEHLIAAGKGALTQADLGFIALAFALALAIGVYSIGKVSDCHVNPAVTTAMLVTRRITPQDAVVYYVAQVIGAILGSLGVLAIWGTDVAKSTSLGVASFASPTSSFQAMVAEAIGAFILLFVITAMAYDPRTPAGWAGLIIGLTLGVVILMMGPVTGASLNPARSFGPMLIKAIFGGKVDWGQLWVYIVGPVVGGVLGALAYDWISGAKRA
jgi:glycerol uptake facilitator protein